jgi:hypothetical protein
MHSSVDGVGSASSGNLGLEESMEASSMGSSTVSSPTGNFFQLKIKKKTKIKTSTTISIFNTNFNSLHMT